MSKSFVKSSFVSPIQSKARKHSESRLERRIRAESKLEKIDRRLRKAIRRQDIAKIESLTLMRNRLFILTL